MLKLVSIFLCLAVLFDSGNTLKCFKCEASTDYHCRKGSPLRREISCGLEHPEFYYFCLKRVIQDKVKQRIKVEYGCDLIGRLAVLRVIPQCQNDNDTRYDIKECRVCTTNLCEFENAACFNVPSSVTLLLSFSIMFFLAKFVLQ